MDIKAILKKIWWFIWEDDSIWSWLVNFILAFILIKFIVYPGLGFVLATDYPVVAVVSGSMEHDGKFDEWWMSDAVCQGNPCAQGDWYASVGVNKEEFQTYDFKNGFNKGDIMVLHGIEPKSIKRGDVLVFIAHGKADPIIHRVTKIHTGEGGDDQIAYAFETKGDHNVGQGGIDKAIQPESVMGKAIFRIPFLGWIKILFMDAINTVLR